MANSISPATSQITIFGLEEIIPIHSSTSYSFLKFSITTSRRPDSLVHVICYVVFNGRGKTEFIFHSTASVKTLKTGIVPYYFIKLYPKNILLPIEMTHKNDTLTNEKKPQLKIGRDFDCSTNKPLKLFSPIHIVQCLRKAFIFVQRQEGSYHTNCWRRNKIISVLNSSIPSFIAERFVSHTHRKQVSCNRN